MPTYYDFEEAFYLGEIDKCKEIGMYLLTFFKDEIAKEMLEDLDKMNTITTDTNELQKNHKLLAEVKRWLLAHYSD